MAGMERHTALFRALIVALSLCAPAAFAQSVPASSATVPSAATVALPADVTTAQDVVVPSASTVAVPSATSVATPADAAVAPEVPTTAESDYNAIYGADVTSSVDPTLPEPATLPEAYDPWEPMNRRIHGFNNAVDKHIARPLAKAYMAVVPRPIRLGVSNFFSNLQQPLTALNSLLQGKPKQAGQALGRFTLNATLGLGGIFDPASEANIPHPDEDFGQTLGKWGWKRSRYVEVPLFGPRTVRDLFGMAGDAPIALMRGVEEDKVRIFLQGLQLVDLRTQLLSLDSMREGAADDYTLVRDAWLQRRNYQIFGDREVDEDQSLPDYLRDDDNPTVPIDAIPMTPMDGG
jgi:phospholipid-binding lipoprotein MlaA